VINSNAFKCRGTAGSGADLFDAYRQGRGPANLIQAQRDFFGAYGFDRLDGKDFHHGPWGSGAMTF
jgi:6-phosphogluconate dehydrogenase